MQSEEPNQLPVLDIGCIHNACDLCAEDGVYLSRTTQTFLHWMSSILPALQRRQDISLYVPYFEPEDLRDAIGSERRCFGMPFIKAYRNHDPKLSAKIGASGQKKQIGSQRFIEIFRSAGLPAGV